MKQEYDQSNILDCPIADVQQIIHGKWAMVVIFYLRDSTCVLGN